MTSSTAVTKRNNLVTQGTKRGISNGSSFFLQLWRANVPENTTIPGESAHTERKCPGNRHKSRRKYSSKGEMSRKSPQYQEKVQPRTGNVPEIAIKPGENAHTEEKCPGKHHKSGRKYNHGKKKEDNPQGLPSISKKMLQLFAQSICNMSFSHLNTLSIKSYIHNITICKEQLCVVVIYKFDKV